MAKAIPIQKSIPIPEPKTVYPFGKMEVGDSFFVEKGKKHIASMAYQYGKRHGMKFSIRMTEKGFRVWRTE